MRRGDFEYVREYLERKATEGRGTRVIIRDIIDQG